MRPVRDHSQLFTLGLAAAWLVVAAWPLGVSVLVGHAWHGTPLLGVVLWFGLLRVARWLSPAARADHLMKRGKYKAALDLCVQALSVEGRGAWIGRRRLVWLNRRTVALLGLGQHDTALTSALEALEVSADPETLGNVALTLLRLNRYEEAAATARLVLSLTRERSVSAHAVLAAVMLARGMPAEAEALAHAGLADAHALFPLVRPEHHVACLAALCRAARTQGRLNEAHKYQADLRTLVSRAAPLRAVALLDEADSLADSPEQRTSAFALLAEAFDRSPDDVLWFVAQPGTLAHLREDERFYPALDAAAQRTARLAAQAPSIEHVALALAAARDNASARPMPQASRQALLVQMLTLSGTLVLLLWWVWRFFLVSA